MKLGWDKIRHGTRSPRLESRSIAFGQDLVDQDIQSGLKIAAKDLEAGKKAMAERNHRRVGLGMSLIAIGMVLVGLRLYIKKIES